MTDRAKPHSRKDYAFFSPIQTRWEDNDQYGHINNVVYYSYFDSAVNSHLISHHLLDTVAANEVGLVVSSSCQYFAPASFPETLLAGLRVIKLGTSSITYAVGIFRDKGDTCIAQGTFTHVYVNRKDNRPSAINPKLRTALEDLMIGDLS